MKPYSEEKILRRCQRGDKSAFEQLVLKYRERAYFTALSFVHNQELAIDLSQDAFIKTWKSIKKIDPQRPFFTWFYVVLKNLCLNDLRRRKSAATPFSSIGEQKLNTLEDNSNSAHYMLEQKQLQEAVWQAINALPEHEKEILLLREFQQLSYKEIATVLDIKEGTVMSRLYTARKALKNKLQPQLSTFY